MQQNGPRDLDIVNGALLDGTGVDPVSKGFVSIRQGRVVAVGAMEKWRRDDTACQLDVSGMTILPGLIDCHAHLVYFSTLRDILEIDSCPPELATIHAIRNCENLLNAGFTTVRDCGAIGHASIHARNAIQNGLAVGPRVLAAGPIIASTGGFTDNLPAAWQHSRTGFSMICDGAETWRAAVRELCRSHVDVIKIGTSGVEVGRAAYTWMTTSSQEEVTAATQEAHQRGRCVSAHCESYEGAKMALRAGVDTIEHGTRLDEEAIDLFLKGDSVLVPTLCCLYGTLEAKDRSTIFPKRVEEMIVNERLWVDSLLLAKERGVPIALGTDIGTRIPHGQNARELEYMVRVGFTPMEAIVAATSGAAVAIRRSGIVGTLEQGCYGDVLVVDGDPLEDIRILQDMTRIHAVVQSGRIVRAPGSPFVDLLSRTTLEGVSSWQIGQAYLIQQTGA